MGLNDYFVNYDFHQTIEHVNEVQYFTSYNINFIFYLGQQLMALIKMVLKSQLENLQKKR